MCLGNPVQAAIDDPCSTASTIVAQRLMPPPKSMMPELQAGLIDNEWIELSNSSKLAYITFLAVSGQISPDQAVAISKLLTDRATMELDQLTHFDDVGLAKRMGELDKLKYYEKLDMLENTLRERAQDDVSRLKEILATDTTDNTDTNDESIAEDTTNDE